MWVACSRKDVVPEALQLGDCEVGKILVGKAEVDRGQVPVAGAIQTADKKSFNGLAGPLAPREGIEDIVMF